MTRPELEVAQQMLALAGALLEREAADLRLEALRAGHLEGVPERVELLRRFAFRFTDERSQVERTLENLVGLQGPDWKPPRD